MGVTDPGAVVGERPLRAAEHRDDPADINRVARVAAARRANALMADALLEGLKVSGLRWVDDPTLGRVNNWIYSQRKLIQASRRAGHHTGLT